MTRRVVFRPEAENEVLETRRWYEERREGLGAEFASAFDAIVERIVTSPLAFAYAHGQQPGEPCCSVSHMPYTFVFWRMARL